MPDLLARIKGALAGRYAVEREIGRGMATVYLADDLKHHRKVAVKVLASELAAALTAERFLQEIRITAKLQHPHILPLHDSGQADGLLYYIMPYVEGESLRTVLQRERQLSLARALLIGREVADALSYAHDENVVHRDIKPENILISAGHAVVADFGIARAISAAERARDTATTAGREGLTATGLTVGTPMYMSPEQAIGGRLDGRSDIYSLGCVVYELLTGSAPFAGSSTPWAQKLVDPVPSLKTVRSDIPPPVEQAIMKALAPTPADRFATAALFADALTIQDSEPTVISLPVPDPLGGAPTNSIAVLPFVNMSADSQTEYLSDGITEELIHALAKLDDLRVVARTSAFAFKGKHEDVRTIGALLNVATVLEGSVRKAENRLRITTQLISTSDGYELWSERYDRELRDVFTLQDEIASAIVRTLKITLQGEEQPSTQAPTENLKAYELYLKGRHYWNQRTEEGLRQSADQFRQAIEEDPNYALALAGLADSYATLGIYGASPPHKVMPLAKAAAQTALRIDSTLSEALTSLACIDSIYDWDWAAGERDFKRAIELHPGYPTAHHWYAINHLTPLGRFDEAREELRKAQQLDPLSPVINTSIGLLHYFERRYDRAIDEYRKVLDLDRHFGMAYYFLGQALTEKSMHDEAIAALQDAMRLTEGSPEAAAALGCAHAMAGNRSEAQRLRDKLLARSEQRYVSPALIGQIYASLGERDLAFEWLARAHELRSAELAWLGVRPVFDILRSDARFAALLEKIGLPNNTA